MSRSPSPTLQLSNLSLLADEDLTLQALSSQADDSFDFSPAPPSSHRRTPSPGPIYGGSMGAVVPPLMTVDDDRVEPDEARTGETDEERALREERDRLRQMNDALEEVLANLQRAEGKVQVCLGTCRAWNTC